MEEEYTLEEAEYEEASPEEPEEIVIAEKSEVETALEILLGVEPEQEQTTGVRKQTRAKAQPVTLADRARAFRARIEALEAEMEVRNETK